MTYQYEVVIKTFDSDKATVLGYGLVLDRGMDPTTYERITQPVDPVHQLEMLIDVFQVGQILIIDESGREVGYPGRKSSKWSVETEVFDTVEEAVKRARAVMDGVNA